VANKRRKRFIILPEGKNPFPVNGLRGRVYQPPTDKEEKEEKGEPSDQQKVAIRQQNSQSFLMGAMRSLMRFYETRKKYTHIIQYHGPPHELVSKLQNPSEISNFIGATSADLSLLTPKIEFFWFEYKPHKKGQQSPAPKVTPFIFSDHVSGDRMIKMAAAQSSDDIKKAAILGTKGTDVGVKEFVWNFDNKHHGDRTIKASLTLQFATIKELLNPLFTDFILQKSVDGDEPQLTKEQFARKIQKRFKYINTWSGYDLKTGLFSPDEPSTGGLKQLKAVVGWSSPDIEARNYPHGQEGVAKKVFLDAVHATQKTIALNYVKHNLTFGAEGQVTAQIEYIGSLDSVMADSKRANAVDLPPGASSKGQQARDIGSVGKGVFILPQAQSYSKGMTFGLAGLNAEGSFKDMAYGATITGEGAEAKFEATSKYPFTRDSTGERKAHGILIRAIYNGIRRNTTDPATGQPGFFFSLDACDYEEHTLKLHKKFIMTYGDSKDTEIDKIDQGLKAIRLVRSLIMSRTSSVRFGKFIEKLYQTGEAKTRYKGLHWARVSSKVLEGDAKKATKAGYSMVWGTTSLGEDSNQGVVDLTSRITKSIVQRQMENAGVDAGDKVLLDPNLTKYVNKDGDQINDDIKIYFFTLGDLLDVALDDKDIVAQVNARVLLGTFNGMVAGVPGARKGDNFSIADFPIAADWFGQWFIDNFAAQNRTEVSLREFLNKLFFDMVAPMMNDAYAEYLGQVKTGFSFTTNTFPDYGLNGPKSELYYEAKNLAIKGNVQPYKYLKLVQSPTTRIRRGERINALALDIVNIVASHPTVVAQTDLPTVNYFTVFATSYDPSDMAGDYDEDTSKGIFHLAVAADRGIVKSFKFSEKKIPQLRAMHVEKGSPGSAILLPQDVDLTMVGNTFFKNGQMIYVDADFALGREVATKLGIGGYYQIVKVENVIDASKFETRVQARWTQKPYKKAEQGSGIEFRKGDEQ
jgi:hypothetical protein